MSFLRRAGRSIHRAWHQNWFVRVPLSALVLRVVPLLLVGMARQVVLQAERLWVVQVLQA